MATTVWAVGSASTAMRRAPRIRSATDVAAPTRSLRDNTTSPTVTTAGLSAPLARAD